VSVVVRRMGGPDLAAVALLETAVFGEEAWSADMLAAELAGEPGGRYYLVAEEDGALAGYGGLLAPGGGQADVLTLAVSEDRWGRGIGAALLVGLLTEARRRGCTEVFLEVRTDNDRAKRLYQRFGFVQVGLRRGYYQPSGADALVMRREVGHTAGQPRAGQPRAGQPRAGQPRAGQPRAGGAA
jgi:ribosomal-protein-alanine N-acetyltransferase